MAETRTSHGHGLARSAIGLREVLFQSITHMAPAAAVAFSIIVGAPFAGGSLPLGVLLALVACLFVASSIGQLAKHLPSAGGFATYASRGLHPSVGFMIAWLYALAEANVGLPADKRAAQAMWRSAGCSTAPSPPQCPPLVFLTPCSRHEVVP